MLSFKKIALTGLITIPVVFILAVRISPYITDVIIRHFSKVHYINDNDSSDSIINGLILFLVFSIVTFYWNVRTLKTHTKPSIPWLIANSLLDLAAIPTGILIMVIKHNSWTHSPDISSLFNPVALAIFPLFKHAVLALLSLRKK